MIKHNKKRNLILIYEFLSRSLVKSILDNDKKQAAIKMSLLKEHFGSSSISDVSKEYKMMKALREVKVSNDSTVHRIFDDVRSFASKIDNKKLNKEKTRLINEMNKIEDKNLFKYKIDDYLLVATISNLLEEYRNPNKEFNIKVSIFEDEIKTHLRTKEEKEKSGALNRAISETKSYDEITMKLAVNKFNEKYKNLNILQRNILSEMVAPDENNPERSKNLLTEAKDEINKKISEIEADDEIRKDSDVFHKLQTLKENVNKLQTNDVSIDMMSEMMKYGEIMNYDNGR